MKSPKFIKQQKHKYDIAMNILLVVVLILSWVVILNKPIENALLSSYKPKLSAQNLTLNKKANNGNYNWSQTSDTNLEKVAQSRLSGDNKPIALMTQPQAKVAVTVGDGTGENVLNLSAGTVRPDQKLGENNYVLAGHHVPKPEWALFSGIYYYAKPGQSVYVTDLQKVYQYKITKLKFVPATATYITNKDNYKLGQNGTQKNVPMITAFSCDATGDSRIAEFGSLTKTYKITDKSIPKEAMSGFNRAADFDWKD